MPKRLAIDLPRDPFTERPRRKKPKTFWLGAQSWRYYQSTSRPRPQTTFLDLPLELRDLIYHDALEDLRQHSFIPGMNSQSMHGSRHTAICVSPTDRWEWRLRTSSRNTMSQEWSSSLTIRRISGTCGVKRSGTPGFARQSSICVVSITMKTITKDSGVATI